MIMPFLFIQKSITSHNTTNHAICLIHRKGNGAQGLWQPHRTGDLQVWIQPGNILAVLTASDWGMQWKLLGAPFQIFCTAGCFCDERFHRKSIRKTATWPLTQAFLRIKEKSERAFLKTICPCIHQEPAECWFILLLQRDKSHKELLMGISNFRVAQFVWILWTILLRDNSHCPQIPTFREKEA